MFLEADEDGYVPGMDHIEFAACRECGNYPRFRMLHEKSRHILTLKCADCCVGSAIDTSQSADNHWELLVTLANRWSTYQKEGRLI